MCCGQLGSLGIQFYSNTEFYSNTV
uniref:Uncharacterized protein n=1 Tax=Arundo donax TaxID=35708 RepID=A0A0A9FE78_ARUDO